MFVEQSISKGINCCHCIGANNLHLGANKQHTGLIWAIYSRGLCIGLRTFLYPNTIAVSVFVLILYRVWDEQVCLGWAPTSSLHHFVSFDIGYRIQEAGHHHQRCTILFQPALALSQLDLRWIIAMHYPGIFVLKILCQKSEHKFTNHEGAQE